jgi:hypothetical protein
MCQPPEVVGSDYPTDGLGEPFFGTGEDRLYAGEVITGALYCADRGDTSQSFGPWKVAKNVGVQVAMDLRDVTWMRHHGTDYLIGANYGNTRTLWLCKPDKGPCQNLVFVDQQGAPVMSKDGINDMDGPSVGLVDGNPVMLVNTSKSNTPGTERVWLARLTGSDPAKWRAEQLEAFPPGADDPGFSRDGSLVVYALKGSNTDSGPYPHFGFWASYRDASTGSFSQPQKLQSFEALHRAWSPEVLRRKDGTIEIYVFGRASESDPFKIYRSICTEA